MPNIPCPKSPWGAMLAFLRLRRGVEVSIPCLVPDGTKHAAPPPRGCIKPTRLDEIIGEASAFCLRVANALDEAVDIGIVTRDDIEAIVIGASIQIEEDELLRLWLVSRSGGKDKKPRFVTRARMHKMVDAGRRVERLRPHFEERGVIQ